MEIDFYLRSCISLKLSSAASLELIRAFHVFRGYLFKIRILTTEGTESTDKECKKQLCCKDWVLTLILANH